MNIEIKHTTRENVTIDDATVRSIVARYLSSSVLSGYFMTKRDSENYLATRDLDGDIVFIRKAAAVEEAANTLLNAINRLGAKYED